VPIRYVLAGALSLLGDAVAAITLPWLILVRTGDAATAGLVAASAPAAAGGRTHPLLSRDRAKKARLAGRSASRRTK
jgi:hypothetical protein